MPVKGWPKGATQESWPTGQETLLRGWKHPKFACYIKMECFISQWVFLTLSWLNIWMWNSERWLMMIYMITKWWVLWEVISQWFREYFYFFLTVKTESVSFWKSDWQLLTGWRCFRNGRLTICSVCTLADNRLILFGRKLSVAKLRKERGAMMDITFYPSHCSTQCGGLELPFGRSGNNSSNRRNLTMVHQ